jgi:hypothetical protein
MGEDLAQGQQSAPAKQPAGTRQGMNAGPGATQHKMSSDSDEAAAP